MECGDLSPLSKALTGQRTPKIKAARALAVKLSPPYRIVRLLAPPDSLISPSRSARSQAFEWRGLFVMIRDSKILSCCSFFMPTID
jgi:hypothetical protein